MWVKLRIEKVIVLFSLGVLKARVSKTPWLSVQAFPPECMEYHSHDTVVIILVIVANLTRRNTSPL